MGLNLKTFFAALSLILTVAPAHAASLHAKCVLQDEDNEKIEGVNINDRYPIASVSKIMTSHWAITKMGVNGRFSTQVHVRRVSEDLYDVHLQGNRDPYFGKYAFQFLVTELNKMGVKKIRNLTFDERFKMIVDTTGNSVASAFYTNSSPVAQTVMSNLRAAVTGIQKGFDGLRSQAKSIRGVTLSSNIAMTVEDISFKSRDDFQASQYDGSFRYQSTVLSDILKEMNRNSNNYAANNIFEALGGPSAYKEFIRDRLGLGTDVIRFVNGSGDRKDTDNGKVYNEATCTAIIQVIQDLRSQLKANGLGLHHVLAVAGRNAPGQNNTLTSYNNNLTEGTLIAKTGTVNPAITLAGMLSTDDGALYFGYIYETNGSSADWRSARTKIRTAVTALIQEHGAAPLWSRPESFLPFDAKSGLTELGRLQ